MPNDRRIRPKAAKGTKLHMSIRVTKAQSIASNTGFHRCPAHLVDEPVPATEQYDRPSDKRFGACVGVRKLPVAAVADDERIGEGHGANKPMADDQEPELPRETKAPERSHARSDQLATSTEGSRRISLVAISSR